MNLRSRHAGAQRDGLPGRLSGGAPGRPELKNEFLPDRATWRCIFERQALGQAVRRLLLGGWATGGNICPYDTDGKHLYGISLGLYGAAAAHEVTKNRKAPDLAQKALCWIDEHAHDAKNGGYFEWRSHEGKVVEANPDAVVLQPIPVAEFPIGYKSMNTQHPPARVVHAALPDLAG
jgi:hypothetical protein